MENLLHGIAADYRSLLEHSLAISAPPQAHTLHSDAADELTPRSSRGVSALTGWHIDDRQNRPLGERHDDASIFQNAPGSGQARVWHADRVENAGT